jgi:hypothetical protein
MLKTLINPCKSRVFVCLEGAKNRWGKGGVRA